MLIQAVRVESSLKLESTVPAAASLVFTTHFVPYHHPIFRISTTGSISVTAMSDSSLPTSHHRKYDCPSLRNCTGCHFGVSIVPTLGTYRGEYTALCSSTTSLVFIVIPKFPPCSSTTHSALYHCYHPDIVSHLRQHLSIIFYFSLLALVSSDIRVNASSSAPTLPCRNLLTQEIIHQIHVR